MSKSIMQNKEDGRCYVCEQLGEQTKGILEEHHCFGGTNRKFSEHYGLKIYLCVRHHREGKDAVHTNKYTRLHIQEDAQRAFEEHYPGKDFRSIFGKNYI